MSSPVVREDSRAFCLSLSSNHVRPFSPSFLIFAS
nr:MAG TPA: hypothetical protein [Bacteriophage sp.]